MNTNLFLQSLTKFLLGVIILGLLIFLPAGSFHYWQGWLLMGILFVPMFVAGLVMMVKNPELLRKRLNAKEQEKEQKTVVALSGLLFVAAFIVAGLNWRFQWCVLPDWAVWVAAALFLVCYLLYAEVLRENTYLSRSIEVLEHQKEHRSHPNGPIGQHTPLETPIESRDDKSSNEQYTTQCHNGFLFLLLFLGVQPLAEQFGVLGHHHESRDEHWHKEDAHQQPALPIMERACG